MPATVEEVEKTIVNKLKVLKLTHEGSEKIAGAKSLKPIQRHRKLLESKVEECHEIKARVQELKLERGDDEDDIRKWSTGIEKSLVEYEKAVEGFEELERSLREEETREIQEKEERSKWEIKKKFEAKADEKESESGKPKAKLPKLVITKFQGTHLDWQRFWGQFEAEIDKSDIGPVAKFSYLKELLVPRVRATIDGLPFTSEGYTRAKNVLKTKYGRPSEVANAHVQSIMGLPVITGTNPGRICEFYEKLVTNIQTLESMGKEKEIRGYVRLTLDKLPGIRADLVRLDDEWQDWGFPQLVEALRKWCERNPVPVDSHKDGKFGRHDRGGDRSFQTKQEDWKPKPCVYCKSSEHKSVDCEKIKGVADRRKYLSANKLCFNCTGTKHRAAECLCKFFCQKCNGKHHTSICDKISNQLMLATGEGLVVYPVVVVKVEGVMCRALLDTGAGSSYASATLIERLNRQPDHKVYKKIEMMMSSTSQKIEMYKVEISNIKGDFSLPTTLSKVDKGVLLTVPNPQYTEVISQHQHLNGVIMDDEDTKQELPIHVILGASEYAKLKTSSVPRVGKPGEPVAELTSFGWTIMSPGAETDLSSVYLTRSSSTDYEQLCSLDVLGLEDKPEGDQQAVYSEFQEQLVRHPEGWYETGLLWKAGHPPLPNNRNGSLCRLTNLVKKLEKVPSYLDEYDRIIQDQLEQGRKSE